MSSRLPTDVRRAALDVARDKRHPDKFWCAGYKHRRHGKFVLREVAVDHIVPEIDDPDRWDDVTNLQVLCDIPGGCHKRKTADEARKRAKATSRRGNPLPWAVAAAGIVGAGVIAVGFIIHELEQRDTGMPWAKATFAAYIWWWVLALVASVALPALLRLIGRYLRFVNTQEGPKASPGSPLPAVDAFAGLRDRIAVAVREVVGAKGDVHVTIGLPVMNAEKPLQTFGITYVGTGFADHVDERQVELAGKVSAKIGGRWHTVWNTERDEVMFVRRTELPPMVEHPGFPTGRPWHIVPVAVDEAGEEVQFDLLTTAHILVQGTTGAGKTVLIRNIIAAFIDSANRGEAVLRLGDPKRIELMQFRGAAGVDVLATSDEDLWLLATEARDEMMRRYTEIEAGASEDSFEPLLLVLDEYEEWLDRMKIHYVESGKKKAANNLVEPPAVGAMKSLLRMGRSARVHVVLGTQRPDAAIMGGASRDLLRGRALVGPATAEASKMCFGTGQYGRDVPASAKGRATFQIGDTQEPFEAQVYYLPERASVTTA